MGSFWQDMKYGLRVLAKKPGFTFVVVITLALGIGANTAIFTVVDAALLHPLQYREADRLVHIWEKNPQSQFNQREASYPDYLDYKSRAQAFEDVAGYTGASLTLSGGDAPERIQGGGVTASFFSVLGITPAAGRAFLPNEEGAGAPRVVMLSYGLWQRRFGGSPEIVGQQITANETGFTVVGVLPKDFSFAPLGSAEVWVPLRPSEMQLSRRYMHWLKAIARLKPGVTIEQATADMQAVAARIAEENPDSHKDASIRLVGLQEQFVGSVKTILLVLVGVVGFVLLIACANIANLMLARSAARQKEFAIRSALGAGRGRLARQLITESLLLAAAGGAVGLLWSQWAVDALVAAIPEQQLSMMPYLRGLAVSWQLVAFTSAITLLTGVAFGLAPALGASKLDLNETLKESGRRSGGASGGRLRGALVVAEVALAMVLLVGAGLMMRSLLRLLEVNPGFNPENLLTMRVALPARKYSDDAQVTNVHRQMLSRIEALPGVKGTASVDILPLIGGNTGGFFKEGENRATTEEKRESNLRTVSSDYFNVMGIGLESGRFFTDRDDTTAPSVVIVNKTLASRFFPGEDPVGKRIILNFGEPVLREIVGVVGDEKVMTLDAATTPVIYFSYPSEPDTMLSLVVRSTGEPEGLAGAVRNEIQSLDRDVPVYAVMTIEQLIERAPSTFLRRYPAFLIGVFAVVALALASVGIYGVISYSVAERTHEIGVRMALGATRRDILRMVVGRGLALTLAGVALGLVASLALTRLLSSLLFGVSAIDPVTFVTIPLVLAGVALGACAVPARRAMKVDPMIALRYE